MERYGVKANKRMKTQRKHTPTGASLGRRALRLAMIAAITGAVPTMTGGTVHAQQDPTSIGAGQKPFVVIVLDTSGSMDFSLEEENSYACYKREKSGASDLSCQATAPGSGVTAPPANPKGPNDPSYFDWQAGYLLGNGQQNFQDNHPDLLDRDYEEADTGPYFVGPCYVWKDMCNTYKRPPWYPDILEGVANPYNRRRYSEDMGERLKNMRGRDGALDPESPGNRFTRRLRDNNQPRHVQLKEILTGDMILRPYDSGGSALLNDFTANPQLHGPGCWFVPRMSGSLRHKDFWHVCQNLGGGGWYSNHPTAFQNFVDMRDPRPHNQEVFDYQLPTGLLDGMGGTAIFAVAMLDSYGGELDSNTGTIKHHSEQGAFFTNDGIPNEGSLPPELPEENGARYNLGVYRVVSPTRLDMPSTQINALSDYAQYSIVDAGYLHNKLNGGEDVKRRTIDPDNKHSAVPYSFPEGLERYVMPFRLGQQPISRATPLAAAVRDIHGFMLNGQVEFDENGEPTDGSAGLWDPNDKKAYKDLRKDSKDYVVSPVQQDPYKRCRAKQIVIMTDGFPEPERPGGPLDVGTAELDEGFGYPEWNTRYPYETAEEHIRFFVEDGDLTDVFANNDIFMPRVHIVSLNLTGQSSSDVSDAAITPVAQKMGLMAQRGKTCALYHLLTGEGRKFVPASWGSFTMPDSSSVSGTCDPGAPRSLTNAGNCLLRQIPSSGSYTYTVPGTSGSDTFDCSAPALMLEKSDRLDESGGPSPNSFRDDMTEALQLIFNQVLNTTGGVASRTRATITNDLADAKIRGQYRVFSGVDISGGSIYWGGLLERQTLACDVAGGQIGDNNYTSMNDSPRLHEEISTQVRERTGTPPAGESAYEDNRRVFTTRPKLVDVFPLLPFELPPSTGSSTIFTNYELVSADDFALTDDFGDAMYKTASNAHLNRIPMGYEELMESFGYNPTSTNSTELQEVFNVLEIDEAKEAMRTLRGHHPGKAGERVLGPILNSSPVAVGPPALDLPIDSYRAYREQYARRAPMIYTSTLDGVLHAIHAGPHNDPPVNGIVQRDFSGVDQISTPKMVTDSGISQREAWAYAPNFLRQDYALFKGRQPDLLDGTPVVSDVRLCHADDTLNFNKQACKLAATMSTVAPVDQWRTVLVQGAGSSRAGYFAMDVTRSGGVVGDTVGNMPDPVVLWEFDPRWERRQIARAMNGAPGNLSAILPRFGYSPEIDDSKKPRASDDSNCQPLDVLSSALSNRDSTATLSFMGMSVAEPRPRHGRDARDRPR